MNDTTSNWKEILDALPPDARREVNYRRFVLAAQGMSDTTLLRAAALAGFLDALLIDGCEPYDRKKLLVFVLMLVEALRDEILEVGDGTQTQDD